MDLKRHVLVFCLCAQDLGIASPADKLSSVLVKLYDLFLTKLLNSMQTELKKILEDETYQYAIAKNDYEFKMKVDKFGIDLEEEFQTNIKITR